MHKGQLTSHFRKIGGAALDMLLPPLCLTCDTAVAEQGGVCAGCWQGISFIAAPRCPVCGVPYELATDDLPCPLCLTDPPPYKQARAAVIYDDHSRNIVLGFKHADQTHTAAAMARMMFRAGADILPECDFLAPVPLHRWRLLARKYNQSALLAHELGKLSGLPVMPDLLIRRRATKPQGTMNRTSRAKNVRGAFAIMPRYRAAIEGKIVGLIDDVLTTGATIEECAKVLAAHGAAGVKVLTFARVERQRMKE
ncbi:MAG: ComF family protein [Alphaproteobacteria bacterium]